MSEQEGNGLEGIAIVGMAGRFPRAADLEQFWRNLTTGLDCISYFQDDELEIAMPPELLRDPNFVKARGVLDEPDLFDARFFDISPRQAELMDPQNRLFLECAHQALEDAGIDPGRYPGAIGVFGGVTMSSYFLFNLYTNPERISSAGGYQIALGTDRDYLTTFVSYKLNLRGPSLDVQTACSTSLVATVLACQNLLSYTCDVALAGGVSVKLPQKSGYMYQPGGLDSLQGRCRAFDAGADGSVYGGGVGVVVLKRLEDALADGDTIHAVILGAALNNDGSAKVGFTAPGIDGQAEVIATAQALAGVDPESIGYVECHGSGTALGDPIEVAALTKAFRAGNPPGDPENERTGYCAIGSVKTNVGHCSAAAGIAGLLKAALALEHRQIPPSLHFERPNPAIDFANSPFYVADRLIDWEADGTPRRAGVSSFGLGGTNAHVVLQEPPELEPSGPSRPWQLLLLSARTEAALETATGNLAADLEAHPERGLADMAFTLQTGRRVFEHRRMLVCRDAEDARRALAERDPRRLLGASREEGGRPVAFLLPGVGDHYPGMARGLYEAEPTFREHLDRCAGLLRPRFDLLDVLFPAGRETEEGRGPDLRRMLGRAPQPEDEASRRLHRTLYAQPAVFAVEYALAQVWMEWGIQPEALLGYSLGEYTAACLAGVLSLEDALLLVAERARLIDDLPAGAMLAVSLPEERARPLLGGDLDVSAINSPGVCVVSGPEEAVARLRERLDADGLSSRRLPTTHAFHSRAMEPVAPALDRLARSVRLAPPRIPYVSNVTGTWITNGEATDPGYWVRHLRQPVRFAQGLATLWKSSSRVLLEVGPGFGLSTLALQQAGEVRGDDEEERLAIPSLRNEHDRQPDEAFLLGALGKFWLAGVDVDWKGFYAHERRRRVRLPTYPFERQRYWVEPGTPGVERKPAPQRQEIVEGALTGDAFERARELAPGTRLVLVEDDEIARRIARLRELEALGAEVVVVGASEAAELPAAPVAPRPDAARYARPSLRNAYVAPESEREVRVAGLFQELLGIEPIGLYDSFFELGGHSLLGTSLLARVRDLFGVELPLRVVFESPTVAGLVEAIDRETAAGPRAPEILLVPRDSEVPLSYAQQRLWFLDRLMPGNPFYNLSGGLLLNGPLDVAALRRSVQEMVRRHETLRTGFAEVDGRPVQRIAAELEIPLPLVDLTGLPESRREEAVRHAAGARALEPYDLGRLGLLRITLLRLEEGGHALLFGMHHIVSDAWSMGVLVREVAALYAAASQGLPSPLPGLPFQYADFAAWQRSWLSGEVLDEQLRYWRERLAGATALELPADRPRPPVQSFRGATLRVSYPRALTEELAALARGRDVSLFMVLFAAFQALLCRYTGEDDVVVGSPIANRTHSGLEGLIGFFVNTLVLRTDLSGDPGFLELIGRVREVSLGAHAHQDLPFEQLVEELQPRRDLSRNPLFQVMFNLINVPAGRLEASDLVMSPLSSPGGTALFDLQAYVTETGEGLDISWEYATDLFERQTIERFSRHFETLLAGIAAAPERRLSELPLLTAAELAQLEAWNDSAREYPGDLCAHQLVEAQVRRTPEAVALVDETGARLTPLTYAELNDRADRLARHLRRQGVGPGTLVAVSMERSAAMVVALLAVWKAGGAYVPLDPSYPAERISYILEDSGARMLDATESNGPARPLEPLAGPEDLAYVIYTSGSTGRPKGVEVRHGGLVNFLASMAREPGLDASDALLAVTTISFDIAGLELWLPLTVGARVALASRDTAVDGARLAEALASTGATLLQATPATWRLLLASGWTGSPGLKALCGGEALPPDLAREIAARTGSLWNVYGPTETTVWSALQPVQGQVSIGRPIANTALHLVGRSWELVPVGALGEIWIDGAGLARGYLRRPELTAERFVPDPFGGAAGARLYRTGDLARRLPDGTIEFLGRLDHQVKIRGFRVELGEIEAALTDGPAVREAAVAVFQEAADDQRLVAYLVREPGFDLPDPRQTLLSRLPSYMVPSAFVELEALPLTPSGKVDRKALPRPDIAPDRDRTEPRTPTEIALAGIWAEVLGVGEVGAEDDFFALGGHSLLGTRVMARIRQALEVDLPLRALFEHPTLAALARAVEQEQGKARGLVIPPLRPRGEDGPAPLSFAQQRLWFMDRLEPGSPFYTLFTAVRLSGGLDVAALRQALDEIVRRHGSLRTAFVEGEQGALQVVQPARPLDVPLIDLETLGREAREAEARRLVAGEAVAPFDLGSGTLLRCRLLRLGGREHAVTCAMHHIASDFLSLQIFVQELAVLYDAFSRGEDSPLPALPVQYADFAVWQRGQRGWLTGEVLESEIAWWKERLTGAPSRIELRSDRPRSHAPDFRGATRALELPAPLMATLQAVSRAEGCTLFMTLLAAFEVLLHHGSGQDDLVVGIPVGYRNWPEIEGAIGLFANTLALRADLGGDPTFRELMARVRRMALGAFAHQHVPFERLVEELRPERSLSHNPLFQVTFNFVAAAPGKPMEKGEAPSLSIAPFVFERETAQFDLSMLLVEGAAGASGSVQYKTGLFDGATVGWMLEQFRRILDRVAVEPDVRLGELRQMLARADEERRAGIDRELEEASFQKFMERRRRAVPALT